jgi:hypothetical protein
MFSLRQIQHRILQQVPELGPLKNIIIHIQNYAENFDI